MNLDLNNYKKLIIKLATSITYKLDDTGMQINRYLIKDGSVKKIGDRSTWKYYLNIAGEYHETDTPMYIYNQEKDMDDLFNKSLLVAYPSIKDELLTQGELYDYMLSTYPEQYKLINGIINPVDIEYAISADDGDILSYNQTLVLLQEHSLIRELEVFIKNTIKRWYLREYSITDSLFIPALCMQISSGIITKIMNIRLDKALTYEAHDYHMYSFFASHREIYKYVDILPLNTKLWLYKNLRYLETHTGKQSTFDIIIENIFSANGIGVGEIQLITEDIEEIEDAKYNEKYYEEDTTTFLTKPLNERYINNNNKIIPRDTLLRNEIDLDDKDINVINYPYDHYSKTLDTKLSNNKLHNVNTKLVDIDTIEYRKLRTLPDLMMVLDNWFRLSSEGKLNYTVDFVDPVTNRLYNITPYQGMLYYIRLLSRLYDKEGSKLEYIHTNSTIDHEYDLYSILSRTFYKDDIIELIYELSKALPESSDNINTLDDFKNYLLNINTVDNLFWQAISNTNNNILSSTLNVIIDEMRVKCDIDMTINGTAKTILELMQINDLDVEINDDHDVFITLDALVRTFTKIDLNSRDSISNLMDNYAGILNTLTSYTIQVIKPTEESVTINAPYSFPNILQSSIPIAKITDGVLYPLEKFIGDISVIADKSEDTITSDQTLNLSSDYVVCDEIPSILVRCEYYDVDTMIVKSGNTNLSIDYDRRCYKHYKANVSELVLIDDRVNEIMSGNITNMNGFRISNELNLSASSSVNTNVNKMLNSTLNLRSTIIDNRQSYIKED